MPDLLDLDLDELDANPEAAGSRFSTYYLVVFRLEARQTGAHCSTLEEDRNNSLVIQAPPVYYLGTHSSTPFTLPVS